MREAFAHDAALLMEPEADQRAPGAAVTVALCGDWDHEPPCPLAPHHSHADRHEGEVRLRILFAAEPADEEDVRRRIDRALAVGLLHGPGGVTTRWQLRHSGRGEVRADELDHATLLLRS